MYIYVYIHIYIYVYMYILIVMTIVCHRKWHIACCSQPLILALRARMTVVKHTPSNYVYGELYCIVNLDIYIYYAYIHIHIRIPIYN